jgi:hypothetical protein
MVLPIHLRGVNDGALLWCAHWYGGAGIAQGLERRVGGSRREKMICKSVMMMDMDLKGLKGVGTEGLMSARVDITGLKKWPKGVGGKGVLVVFIRLLWPMEAPG